MVDDDPQIENSPLCGNVTADGITVRVAIYRLAVGDDTWTLEVVDEEGGSTVRDGRFISDRDAYAEFKQTLEAEGIRSLLSDVRRLN